MDLGTIVALFSFVLLVSSTIGGMISAFIVTPKMQSNKDEMLKKIDEAVKDVKASMVHRDVFDQYALSDQREHQAFMRQLEHIQESIQK